MGLPGLPEPGISSKISNLRPLKLAGGEVRASKLKELVFVTKIIEITEYLEIKPETVFPVFFKMIGTYRMFR